MNETLQHAAHVYATLAKEIKDAERNVEKAKTALQNLRLKQEQAGKTLGEGIGQNIPRRAMTVSGGIIVTIGYNEGIHVFEEGEEIR